MNSIVLALALLVAQLPADAQQVESVIDRLTGSWARGDASAVAAMASRNGMSLDLGGKPVGPLASRQVGAMLRQLFDERETLSVRPKAPQVVGGTPPRASAEITWTTRARGTTIPEQTSVFVALIFEKDRWRITEIRLVQ